MDKKLILVAEDDEVSFQFLKTIFAKLDIEVIKATNGIEAVEKVDENPGIFLILMDIKMPGMDGLNATKQIKKKRPDIIIIAQTAYALNSEKAKFLSEGCDDYISKPIEIDLLMKILNRYGITKEITD